MFHDALLEKLPRHGQTSRRPRPSAAMAEIMDGGAAPAQMAGLLVGLAMKGERPAEIVGLRRGRCASARSRCPSSRARRVDTCGTGGDRARHVQHLVGRRARRRRPAACRWPSTATDRCRAGAAAPTSSRRSASTSRPAPAVAGAVPGRGGHRVPLRADVPPVDAPRGAARRELGVRTAFNLLGPLTNPARRGAPARRRAAAGADRADRAGARAARVRARLGRARRGRPRRDLDDGLHEGVGVPRRRGEHVLRAPGGRRPAEGAAGGAGGRRRGDERRHRAGRARGRPRAGARRRAAERRRGAVRRRPRRAPVATASRRRRAAIDSGAARRTLDALVRWSAAPPPPPGRRRHEGARPLPGRRRAARRDRGVGAHDGGPTARARAARRAGARRGTAAAGRPAVSRRARARPAASTSSPSASGGRRRAACWRQPTTPAAMRPRLRAAGAAAISVLTEPTFFDGALAHLEAVRAAVVAPAAAQGLHRRRVPAARGARRRRRRRPADRRRARPRSAASAVAARRGPRPGGARRGALEPPSSPRAATPARTSSA